MLKNYIKIAWRNFIRNKFYSFINVFGLAIGLGCLIVIMLFVTDELSYDNFHKQNVQIHFVGREAKFGEKITKDLGTSYPLGPTMQEQIPEVEHYLVTMWPGSAKVNRPNEEPSTEDNIMMSTPDFFQVFNFPLVSGNPQTVLSDPNSVVLTEEMADKYFPGENPIGKTIRIQRYGDLEYTVTGIAEDMQHNSFVNFDFIASILSTSFVKNYRQEWGVRVFHTYVKLQDGAEWEQIGSELASIVDTQIGEDSETTFFSIPISRLYLSEHVTSLGFKGNMKYIYIFSAIALFILLLAFINYMNLATARAMQRSSEVGIRKVLGADRAQLIRQFLGEATLTTIVAFFIGLVLAEAALPLFNEFVGKGLTLDFSKNATYISSLFGIALIVGLLSGSYPAFFISRFSPSGVLKGAGHKRLSGSRLRKILVVTQFTVSTVLIICSLIAFNQLNYLLDKDLGFDDEQVMYIPANSLKGNIDTFKEAISDHSAIIKATAADAIPGQFTSRLSMAFDPNKPEDKFSVHKIRTDADYDDVLNLEMVAGRYFDSERTTDGDKSHVINEAMLEELGWGAPDSAIGRELRGGAKVIGVVKDFNFQSLHNKITPLLIVTKPTDASRYQQYDLLAIRFKAGQVEDVIPYVQQKWETLEPSRPMTYYFLDEKFAEQYETDQKLSLAFSAFGGIAIFIACIGLLGLAAFSAQRRFKEIGIRKVLGATISDIVMLLSKDFLKLVIFSFVIAIPIAWYAMNKWLADFAYRVEVGPLVFVASGLVVTVIAFLTVSWQSLQVAVANPVDSLRSE